MRTRPFLEGSMVAFSLVELLVLIATIGTFAVPAVGNLF
jgi:Tfp pilus assembly protein FimT